MDVENIQIVLFTPKYNCRTTPEIWLSYERRRATAKDKSTWDACLLKDSGCKFRIAGVHLTKMTQSIPTDGSQVDLMLLFKRPVISFSRLYSNEEIGLRSKNRLFPFDSIKFIDKGTESILGESIKSLDVGNAHRDVEAFLALYDDALRVMGTRLRLGHFRFIRMFD